MAKRVQKRVSKAELAPAKHYIIFEDASGDQFMFSDSNGEWHEFVLLEEPMGDQAETLSIKLPFELEENDPDNAILAAIAAKRFNESAKKGKPLANEEIVKVVTKAKKIVAKMSPRKQEKVLDADNKSTGEESDLAKQRAGLTPLQMIGWIGLPVVGLALYINYRKRG